MSAPTVESKSAKKRKVKTEAVTTADTASHTSDPAPTAVTTNGTDASEGPYLKELSK